MAHEIERKFLVTGNYRDEVADSTRITQGYLNSSPERSVRVRIRGDRGYLTVKGMGNASGTTRFEWEHEIPPGDAEELLKLCEPGVIDKTRHLVRHQGHLFEIDEFHGDNAGLVVAELELGAEEDAIARPGWLGPEVTGDARYYNASLVKNPFCHWSRDGG